MQSHFKEERYRILRYLFCVYSETSTDQRKKGGGLWKYF